MEAHFVHQLSDADLFGSASEAYHRLAIISLMYELGTALQCNVFLNHFWNSFPEAPGVAQFTGSNPNLNEKLSYELAQGYYHWYGSLTVPPCTEGVSWNLLKTTETVCQAQVTRLTKALAESQQGVAFNNRVTQNLNHRAVSLMEAGNPRPAPANYNILPAAPTNWYYAGDGTVVAAAPTKADAKAQKLWGGLCTAGHEQSPINILTAETVKKGLPHMSTNLALKATLTYVRNTGNGFQIGRAHV